MNIVLREVTTDDGAWLDSWLPAGLSDSGARGGTGNSERRLIDRDGARAGVVVFRVDARKRCAALLAVATPREHARSGTGMRAAALIEQELRRRGVRRILAPATEEHGIAVYFWIRLGYRPLALDASPCAAPGVAWFARAI